MSYTNVYPSRINWENEPSIASPINATNLNKIDYAVYEHDQTFETWDVTKANQSDLLLSVKSIDYDTDTGVFVFTWQNGTTKTVDLNIEKIPVSFSMSPQGVITMTTDDGTTYTADVGSLIKTYTFADSSVIDFTVTTDASGNKTVTADIVDGSIDGTKLVPNYLADCQTAKTGAENAANDAEDSSEDSEAWAVGERDGVPVPSTDPAYNNNAKYWAQHTSASFAGLSDTDINSPQDGQVPVYNSTSQKWENADQSAGGGSKVVVSTAEASLIGTTCTLSQGGDSYTATFDSNGVATFEGVTLTGTVTITATDGQSTATRTLEIPYFGNYTQTISFFSATITATFPADKGATCTCDGVTASTSPYTFTVGAAGTYSVVCTLDGVNKSVSVPISTDGQAESVNFAFGTINLTYDNAFRGLTITCVNGGTTISKTAPISGNTMAFYPPSTGEYSVSGTYSGQTYSVDAEVTSLSTPVSVQLQTQIVATVTLHGANGATISYIDANGSHTQTLDSSGEKANVTVAVNPENPYITFIDTDKSKIPYDLSEEFFRRYEITSATTDIYVTPDNALYWYGYQDNLETCNTTNGWNTGGSQWTYTDPTYNVNAISLSSTGTSKYCFVGSHTTVPCTKIKKIAQGNTVISSKTFYGYSTLTNKDLYNSVVDVDNVTSSSVAYYENTASEQEKYLAVGTYGNGVMTLSGLWYDTATTPTTPTYYSAACDVLYIKDSSNNVIPIAYTDTEGKCYDAISLPNGTYTIYSSVAKNPSDLSAPYSKSVTITNATTSIYVMPSSDKVLYWYGYISSNLENCSSANGWTPYSTYVNPTYNNNNVNLYASSSSSSCSIGTKNKVTATSLHVIVKKLSGASGGSNIGIGVAAKEATGANATYKVETESSSDVYLHTSFESVESYSYAIAVNQRQIQISAYWYE